MSPETTRRRFANAVLTAVAAVGSLGLVWASTSLLVSLTIQPLAVTALPLLAAAFAFAGLLYNRARALPTGRSQRRSLYAAERATQGTVFILFGVLIAGSVYGLLNYLRDFGTGQAALHAFSLISLPSAFLLQAGYLAIIGALKVIAPQFFGKVGMREVWLRVR